MLQNFNDEASKSLYPRYAGGRPPTFTLPQRQAIKKIGLARPQDDKLALSTRLRLHRRAAAAVDGWGADPSAESLVRLGTARLRAGDAEGAGPSFHDRVAVQRCAE